ncbi:MAG: recombinase family protein, partial [bacterium]|nr:recombinase family protein [bacterium]
MKKIAIYYRVSTDKQEFASQKYEVELWLQSVGFSGEIRIYEDHGKSGLEEARPEFCKMLHNCYRGKHDTIVCYKLDRFSRNAMHAIRTIIKLAEANIGFVATSQPALDLQSKNPMRLTILTAFAEIAQIEREQISSRIKAGIKASNKKRK